jgi:site-specific recombinase XerD
MNKCEAFFLSLTEPFISFRKACDCWNEICYGRNLKRFVRHCAAQFPEASGLTQEMVDGWCGKRDTESNNSCRARVYVVGAFVEYLRERGLTDAFGPSIPQKQKCRYIPHAFTEQELANFFRACDEIEVKANDPIKITRKLTVPVFFRLLYSSGLRTNEARQLRAGDVDLKHGVLNISASKGTNQRFVVLHDSMLRIMRQYDSSIKGHCPGRQFFFPSLAGDHYRESWLQDNFQQLWSKYNDSRASAYDLRHNYAVANVNRWIGDGFDYYAKLVCLSKSMGHSTLESTKYYVHLVPALAELIESGSGESFDDIVPEVDYAPF